MIWHALFGAFVLATIVATIILYAQAALSQALAY
jgi:hypothetical protein